MVAVSKIELNNDCKKLDLYNKKQRKKLQSINDDKFRLGIPIKLIKN